MAMQGLAQRAVACKGFRWMAGMRATNADGDSATVLVATGPTVVYFSDGASDYRRIEEFTGAFTSAWSPDLDCASTMGCVLKMAREAWGDDGLAANGQWSGDWKGQAWHWRMVAGKPHGGTFRRMVQEPRFTCEGAAVIAALESAP